MPKLTHFSLFSGIGGIDLAAEWAGFESVGQCEFADYQTKVLEKHWPNVPRWRDVRDVNAASIRERGIGEITLLSGGYPCQGESLVGKRKGKEDLRWLWPEMFRFIREIKPAWVLGENVVGHVTSGLDEVLSDLEKENYSTRAFVLPACVFEANHERYRVFVIGHSNDKPVLQAYTSPLSGRSKWNTWQNTPGIIGREVPGTYWEVHQPPVCGMDDGTADWMDRNKPRFLALGNAVVPQQVYPILKAIADIEVSANVQA